MRTGRNSQRGYALIIMIVLLAMGLLYGVVSQLSLVGAKVGRAQGTQAVLVQAKEALIGFAATYRDNNSTEVFGYLPCPDTVGDGLAHTPCGSAGATVVGLLPYRTLGLEDLRDSANVCLWYVVSGTFKDNPKTTPMNWDTQGKIAVLDVNGNSVVAPDDANGGGAAVIIATGAPLSGQSRSTSTNTCGAVPSAAQVAAYLDGGYTFPNAGTVTLTQGSTGSSNNNDLILSLTPKEIFSRIIGRADFKNPATGSPVGQINALTTSIKVAIEKQIQNNLLAGGTPTGVSLPEQTGNSYTQFPGPAKLIGDVSTALAFVNLSDINYLANWRNQYRYKVCGSLTMPCLTIAGSSCRAALLLGGRSTTGGPRTTGQNASTTTNLGYFFETGKGLELLNSGSTTFSGNTSYMDSTNPNAAPSDDAGICLFPGAFKSFTQDIAEFSSGLTKSGNGGNALASVNTVAKTVTFGSSSGIAGAGCVWDANVLPMNTLLRLYFRLNFTTKGNGLTVALADGATNLAPNNGARAQIMCGAQGSDTLGYSGIPPADASGIPPAGTTVGIKSPKLGIEFDTRYDSSRNDPYTDHVAFLYWGNAADNGAGGNGADDNTHYLGIGGAAVTATTWASNVATVATASAHGFSAGNVVLVSGVAPDAYNGTYTVLTATSTQFTYALSLSTNPGSLTASGMVKPVSAGAAPRNPRIATALGSLAIPTPCFPSPTCPAWSPLTSGRVTVNTATPHNLSVGQKVYVSGISPAGYNGLFTVSAVPNPTQFRYLQPTNPGLYVSGGSFLSKESEISALGWSSSTAHADTTPDNHGFSTGQSVTVAGVTPPGYNISGTATNLSSRFFDYPIGTDPGGSFSAEAPAGMSILKNSTTAPHSYLRHTSIPTATSIYVRLDISRSYDSANHIAVLSTKAYIGDTFGSSPDTCTSASDFQDLTQDLADLCPFRTVTLQQDSIPIRAIATLTSPTTWSSSTVSATTVAAHRLVNGATITISGVTPAAYNGTYTVAVTGTNTFTYSRPVDPGSYVSGGDIQPLSTIYLGFTNARGTTSSVEDQSVTIDQLLLRSQ